MGPNPSLQIRVPTAPQAVADVEADLERDASAPPEGDEHAGKGAVFEAALGLEESASDAARVEKSAPADKKARATDRAVRLASLQVEGGRRVEQWIPRVGILGLGASGRGAGDDGGGGDENERRGAERNAR